MGVREATAADLAGLLPLMRAYCDFYEADPSDDGLLEMARGVMAMEGDQGALLVAEDVDEAGGAGGDQGGPVVGFAAMSWKWSSLRGARIAVLDDLFVAPEARGQGHADALIRACAERARRHGAPVVTWLTAPDNLRAQAVYNRAGATSEPFLEYELELAEK